jgi:hypothetical protein
MERSGWASVENVGRPMSRTIADIAEAFSRHEFEETYQHMLEDIDWQLVGEKHIRGRGSVVAACEETRKSLISVRTTFSKFRVITAERSVVIDSGLDMCMPKVNPHTSHLATYSTSRTGPWLPLPHTTSR